MLPEERLEKEDATLFDGDLIKTAGSPWTVWADKHKETSKASCKEFNSSYWKGTAKQPHDDRLMTVGLMMSKVHEARF